MFDTWFEKAMMCVLGLLGVFALIVLFGVIPFLIHSDIQKHYERQTMELLERNYQYSLEIKDINPQLDHWRTKIIITENYALSAGEDTEFYTDDDIMYVGKND